MKNLIKFHFESIDRRKGPEIIVKLNKTDITPQPRQKGMVCCKTRSVISWPTNQIYANNSQGLKNDFRIVFPSGNGRKKRIFLMFG